MGITARQPQEWKFKKSVATYKVQTALLKVFLKACLIWELPKRQVKPNSPSPSRWDRKQAYLLQWMPFLGWADSNVTHPTASTSLPWTWTSSKWTTLHYQCQTVSGELNSPESSWWSLWSPKWSLFANPSPKRMTSAFAQMIHTNSSATLTLGTISKTKTKLGISGCALRSHDRQEDDPSPWRKVYCIMQM